MNRLVVSALAALTLSSVAARAEAMTFLLDFDRTGQGGYAAGGPLAASLYLDVSDTLNALGGFDVLGVSGSVDGDEITGLAPDANLSHPNADVSADGWFIFDQNLFTEGGPYVSNPGLLFDSATQEYNLFSNGGASYELIKATPHVGYTGDSVGTVSVGAAPPPTTTDLPPETPHLDMFDNAGPSNLSGAPEPSAWAMLLVGVGLLGAALRTARRRDAAGPAA